MKSSDPQRRWKLGDLVKKKRGSEWRGEVVGFYSTGHTPEGYGVKSLFENGSVQVWPLEALEDWDGLGTPEQLIARIKVLEDALEQGAVWFDDYARQHRRKANACVTGDFDEQMQREAKVRTNMDRADHLRQALQGEQSDG